MSAVDAWLEGLLDGAPLLIAASLAFHRAIERPMTDKLNGWLGGRGEGGAKLTQTLAP